MKCRVCHEYYLDEDNHLCYLRAFSSDLEPDKFIFYDFECTQEEGKHEPNFVVVHSICNTCEKEPVTAQSTCKNCVSRCQLCDKFNKKENEWERNPCPGCGKRQMIFSGSNTGNEFCTWLISEQHRNVTAIAHNSRTYDAYFIYDYLMRNSIVPEPSIFSGSKIMFMKVGKGLNIRILDSLNFLPMPLASLPKSFGLEELKKGYFPHFYNTVEHQNEVLCSLPDMKFYDPDSMSKDRRKDFLEWYEIHKNDTFDFQKEMREYCISDVDILLKACWKLRKLLRNETGEKTTIQNPHDLLLETVLQNAVDPFSFLTIASVCMGIFRSKFLNENWFVLTDRNAQPQCSHDIQCHCTWLQARKMHTSAPLEIWFEEQWLPETAFHIVKKKFVSSPIGLIPTHGYSGKDNHSKESLEWLALLEKQFQNEGKLIRIQHARHPLGEKSIICQGNTRQMKYKVDGYFEFEGKKYVCEYHGCNFHGCQKCFPRQKYYYE